MRIDESKYPVLEKLNKGIFGVIGMSPSDAEIIPMHSEAMDSLRDTFKANIPAFKKSIKYLSAPLCDAMVAAREKLLAADLILKLGSCCGTFLIKDLQFCYIIRTEPMEDSWEYICFAFAGNKFVSFSSDDGKQAHHYASSFLSEDPNPSILERRQIAKKVFWNVLLAINFLKYAEIEIKHLPPSRQIYDGPNCLYNNKTKHNIEIIDSTWFTTLIKSEEFKVRGHFRLQPYGEGLSKIKLVWINEFKKHGYTREARKIKENSVENG